MTKIEFNKLEILMQLKYINSLLKEGKSLRSISSDLNMSKTTFRDRFAKIGYVHNPDTKQYCKDNTLAIQSHRNITKTPQKTIKQVVEPVKKDDTKVLQKYEDDLIELINRKDDILKMLKNYKSNTTIIDIPQLNISSLPQDMQKDITNRSIKIYNPVYKLFDEVCSQYGGIKKQDLISLALYEFTTRYMK